jgi:tRNA nucleotidyltransferase (CCA-adding enzyme)
MLVTSFVSKQAVRRRQGRLVIGGIAQQGAKIYSARKQEPLDLSNDEAELFRILNVVADMNGTNTTLRVAGGWVRDKLLGHSDKFDREIGPVAFGRTTCTDIDIALDDQLGSEFAQKVHTWLAAKGEVGGSFATIQKNPEKSKHLETATMMINGFSVDFVNLRTEVYTGVSRKYF